MLPSASIVITTKNRKEALRRALFSAVAQTAAGEIVVVDDGSTDGTAALVETEFPQVRLIRCDESSGYIVQRNRAASMAVGGIIFSIDDDAEFSTPNVIAQTLVEFDHSRIGAVAIPYIEPRKSLREHQRAPGLTHTYVTDSFIGTAHALRKDLFLRLGGYRHALIHQGEESDFCVRLLDVGYVVRLGRSDPIFHYEAARDSSRMDYYGARNTLIFAWQNVPTKFLPLHWLAANWNVAKWTLHPLRFLNRIKAIADAHLWCLRNPNERRPVNSNTYRLFRTLRKIGAVQFDEVEAMLNNSGD